MAQYTVTRNERKQDKEIHLDYNGIYSIIFDGSTATADLTEDQVNYLRAHGYNVEEVVTEEETPAGE